MSASWRRDLLFLGIVFGAVNFVLLGRMPLVNPDEARYAEIAREMVARGDWVTPVLNEVPYFEKPPLVYWAVAAVQAVFGGDEFAARVTPALAGLGGILLAYAAGRQLFGREAGLVSAVVLGTSLLYFMLSRLLLLDMPVSVLMSAALFSFLLGMREPPGGRRAWLFHGLYAAAALATLTKGLIGFLLPGAIIFLWLLLFDQWHRLRPLYLPSGVLLFLALAAPWHVVMAGRNPEWAGFYFAREHWERFTTTTHERGEPFWYFVPILALGFFPWIGFLPRALREALAGGWRRRRENADTWFLVVWAAFVFLFFSASQSKLVPYILPVFPPLALLVGKWIAAQWHEQTPARLRPGMIGFGFLCGVLAIAVFTLVTKPGAIRVAEQALALKPYGIVLAFALLLGGVAAPWAVKVWGVLAGIGTMVTTMLSFFLLVVLASPELRQSGTRELAVAARTLVPESERVFHYWAFFHDFVYFTGRPVGLVNYIDELEVQFLDADEREARFITDAELRRQWQGAERIWLVVRKRDQSHPESVFADPDFRFHIQAETRTHRLISNRR